MIVTQIAVLVVIVLILIIAVVLALGLFLRKKRSISLKPQEKPAELTREQRPKDYEAKGGFSFSEGASGQPPLLREEKTRDHRPSAPRPDFLSATQTAPAPGTPTEAPSIPTSGIPAAETDRSVQPVREETEPHAIDDTVRSADSDIASVIETVEAETVTSPHLDTSEPETRVVEDEALIAPESTLTELAADQEGTQALTVESATIEVTHEQAPESPAESGGTIVHGGAVSEAEHVSETERISTAEIQKSQVSTEVESAVTPSVAIEPAVQEERPVIEPTEGRLSRLRGRLARSQNTVGKGILGLLGAGDLDEDSWEEIEDTLILADLGTATTMRITDRLREELASTTVRSEAEVRELLREVLVAEVRPELDRSIRALPHNDRPSVILVVGVNGTGKTTTTGKLARVLVADGRRVLLGAADTFRAAAADQLQTWGEQVGAETVRGKEGGDPASVAYDAVDRGIDEGVDVVLIDTAGRLHTKTGLMDELDKVKRVVEKRAAVDEVLLVLDATVGQNGLTQARAFRDVVDITGVVLTKLDGTAKGGIVFQIQEELNVPVKLVGLGEGADDLAPFEPGAFIDALLG